MWFAWNSPDDVHWIEHHTISYRHIKSSPGTSTGHDRLPARTSILSRDGGQSWRDLHCMARIDDELGRLKTLLDHDLRAFTELVSEAGLPPVDTS